MPTEGSLDWFGFAAVEGRAVIAAFDGGALTTDAGGLMQGATDRVIRRVDRVAGGFADRRCPELIEHEVRPLIGQRVFGIALGYEDLNDHDERRHDPVAIEGLFVTFSLEAHRRPPTQIILDLEATDDPIHGHQERRFLHGY
jgi:hypothetical protein